MPWKLGILVVMLMAAFYRSCRAASVSFGLALLLTSGCAMENGEVYVGKEPPSKAGAAATPAKSRAEEVAAFDRAIQESPAYEAVAKQFIAAAAAGDADAMTRLLSPNERRHTGDATINDFSRGTIAPFFKQHPTASTQSVSGITDSFGSTGYAFWGFATNAAGKDRKPYTIYVVREGGKLVVASATVNQFVKGRHG